MRELLAEGTFHEATVEQVADRAGVSRATVYQHFASRLELVDSVCDVMGVNPALVQLRKDVVLADAGLALERRSPGRFVLGLREPGPERAVRGCRDRPRRAEPRRPAATRPARASSNGLWTTLPRSGRLAPG